MVGKNVSNANVTNRQMVGKNVVKRNSETSEIKSLDLEAIHMKNNTFVFSKKGHKS